MSSATLATAGGTGPIFGIDLGNTYSSIAYVDETGKTTVVPNVIGQYRTPSVVYFEADNQVLVGRVAKDTALLAPDLVAEFFRRDMGARTEPQRRYHDVAYTPEMISALVLRYLVSAVEKNGLVVRDVVITVPAYFGIAERDATRRAGKIAGLNVVDLLDEPIAALLPRLASGRVKGTRHVLVCDLGGSSYDVSVLRQQGDDIRVIRVSTDEDLGGVSWDERVQRYLLDQFVGQHPALDVSEPVLMQDVAITAELLRERLSHNQVGKAQLRFRGATARIELSRDTLDELTADLRERVVQTTSQTIESAGIGAFDDVLLVGGMARMPFLSQDLSDQLHLSPRVIDEPELAVTKGAALFGARLGTRGVPSLAGNELPRPHSGVTSDAASAVDLLGMRDDVETVATLLAAKTTAPPLSVALLGSWGMGKSSLMVQIGIQIDRLASASAASPRDSAYVSHVRQVRFNAWHYSDDHLWAGLIEHLFRELSAPARATPKAAEPQARDQLEAQLRAEHHRTEELAQQLERIEEVELGGWLGGLNQPFRAQRVLRAAGKDIWREARHGKSIWIGLLLLVIGGLAIAAGAYFGQAILGVVAGLVAGTAGILSPVVTAGQRIGRLVDDQQAKLKQERASSEERAKKIEGKLRAIDPVRRLDDLLTEIGAADRYASFRGLTGRIHYDLDQLNRHLTEARDHWETTQADGQPPLQRIILYVDDLDRCRADRVIEVLQAVNLLLSMPLFMVVVAVDPIWLLRALEDYYGKNLLATRSDDGQYRSLDYLDKIFHVAYALRAPSDIDADLYLGSLLSTVYADTSKVTVGNVLSGQQQEPAQPVQASPSGDRPSGQHGEEEPVRAEQAQTPPLPGTEGIVRLHSDVDLSGSALELSATETAFIPTLRPLLPTPRSMKKLTNLYRLLRISNHGNLVGIASADGAAHYQVAALLLAALVGSPRYAGPVLARLSAPGEGEVLDVLRELTESPLATRLVSWIEQHEVSRDLAIYRRWAREVARYGFETYHLFSHLETTDHPASEG